MLLVRVLLLFSLVSAATLFAGAQNAGQNPLQVVSPNGQSVFTLSAVAAGQAVLRYSVDFHGKRLIDESELGLDLDGQPPLGPGSRSTNVQHGSLDETYTIPV